MSTITVTLGKPTTPQMVSESSGKNPHHIVQGMIVSVLDEQKPSGDLVQQKMLKYANTLKTKKEIGGFFDNFTDGEVETPLDKFIEGLVSDLVETVMEPAEGEDTSDPVIRKAIASAIQSISKTKPSEALIQYFVDLEW